MEHNNINATIVPSDIINIIGVTGDNQGSNMENITIHDKSNKLQDKNISNELQVDLQNEINDSGENDDNRSIGEDPNIFNELTIQGSILNDSSIIPAISYCTQPTSNQKLWAAFLLGFIFAIMSSPIAYYITSL